MALIQKEIATAPRLPRASLEMKFIAGPETAQAHGIPEGAVFATREVEALPGEQMIDVLNRAGVLPEGRS